MIKSELIAQVAAKENLTHTNAERAVTTVLDSIIKALSAGKRVELRGFGVLSVRTRKPRKARNPKTGESVEIGVKRVPFFKAGKAVKDALNKK